MHTQVLVNNTETFQNQTLASEILVFLTGKDSVHLYQQISEEKCYNKRGASRKDNSRTIGKQSTML